MKNIVIYTGDAPKELQESIDDVVLGLNQSYSDMVRVTSINEKYTYISEVIVKAIKDNSADTLIYITISSGFSDKHIGSTYIDGTNENMKNMAESIKYSLLESNSTDQFTDFDIVEQETIYTKNDIANNITLAFNDQWYNGENTKIIKWSVYGMIIGACDLFSKSKKVLRNAQSNNVITKYFVKHNKKFILENSNKDIAINACNKKYGAVVLDNYGNVVHKSTLSKIPTISKQSFINNGQRTYANPSIPTHIIKKTTGANKF